MNRRHWIAVAVLAIGGVWFLNLQSFAHRANALRLGMSREEIGEILGAAHSSIGVVRLGKSASAKPHPQATILYYGRAAKFYNETIRHEVARMGAILPTVPWPLELKLEGYELSEIRVRGRIIDAAE